MRDQHKAEAVVVLGILSTIAVISGSQFTDWTASLAVFLGFLHAQHSFQVAQKIDALEVSGKGQFWVTTTLHFCKEAIWITTFACLGCYPLLAGAVLFATYPFWREGFAYLFDTPTAEPLLQPLD
ncbi:MAG: hypothetical protein ACO3XO_04025 [Bdellovibrionota bacterium]|jgi:hypothetical protein